MALALPGEAGGRRGILDGAVRRIKEFTTHQFNLVLTRLEHWKRPLTTAQERLLPRLRKVGTQIMGIQTTVGMEEPHRDVNAFQEYSASMSRYNPEEDRGLRGDNILTAFRVKQKETGGYQLVFQPRIVADPELERLTKLGVKVIRPPELVIADNFHPSSISFDQNIGNEPIRTKKWLRDHVQQIAESQEFKARVKALESVALETSIDQDLAGLQQESAPLSRSHPSQQQTRGHWIFRAACFDGPVVAREQSGYSFSGGYYTTKPVGRSDLIGALKDEGSEARLLPDQSNQGKTIDNKKPPRILHTGVWESHLDRELYYRRGSTLTDMPVTWDRKVDTAPAQVAMDVIRQRGDYLNSQAARNERIASFQPLDGLYLTVASYAIHALGRLGDSEPASHLNQAIGFKEACFYAYREALSAPQQSLFARLGSLFTRSSQLEIYTGEYVSAVYFPEDTNFRPKGNPVGILHSKWYPEDHAQS